VRIPYDVAEEVGEARSVASEATTDCGWGEEDQSTTNDANRTTVAALVLCEMSFLKRIVRNWHRNPADAEDLLQQTVLRMLASAHAWHPGTDFRAWAFTVMRNQFRADLARTRRETEAIAQIEQNDLGLLPNVSDERLTMRDVQWAIEHLPPNQREAIFLVGIEGKSYQAAASIMGISVPAVRCHLGRARERLRLAVLGAERAFS
jgi:RNA polymerase sigma-70 factor (ECF subfamily)